MTANGRAGPRRRLGLARTSSRPERSSRDRGGRRRAAWSGQCGHAVQVASVSSIARGTRSPDRGGADEFAAGLVEAGDHGALCAGAGGGGGHARRSRRAAMPAATRSLAPRRWRACQLPRGASIATPYARAMARQRRCDRPFYSAPTMRRGSRHRRPPALPRSSAPTASTRSPSRSPPRSSTPTARAWRPRRRSTSPSTSACSRRAGYSRLQARLGPLHAAPAHQDRHADRDRRRR